MMKHLLAEANPLDSFNFQRLQRAFHKKKQGMSQVQRLTNIAIFLIAVTFLGCASEMKRGSESSLYTIAGVLEVYPEDIGKSIQLKLNQKLFLKMSRQEPIRGEWSLLDYEKRTLILLSENPKVEDKIWGIIFQARALGRGEVTLKFSPEDETLDSQTVNFAISISK